MPVGEVDVFFVEDGGPLEGGPMHPLTSRTMAILARQRFFSAQLILNRAAVAFSLPLGLEILALFVDPIGRAELPLVFGAVGPVAGLVLVRLAAVGALVAFFVFVHFAGGGGCADEPDGGGNSGGKKARKGGAAAGESGT